MPDYKEGQIATNPKTGQSVVYKGGQWVATPSAPGSPIAAPPLSPQDRNMLNTLNSQAANALEIQKQYDAAVPLIHRLKPGPNRGAFLDTATAQDGGGFWDKAGAIAIGGPARLIGAISPQDTEDFQALKAIQARRVLEEQTRQKGVQTEGDAARIKAGDIGPYFDEKTNMDVIARQRQVAARAQQRAQFYTKWAQTYGLNKTNPGGDAVETAFNKLINAQPATAAPKVGGPTIRRIQ